MANGICLILIATLFINAILLFVDARKLGASNGILKTIKTPDGEVIDCVDIYKQPAFSHPLLKNHTIQLKPSFETKTKTGVEKQLKQSWQQYGECPQGSVPILRPQNNVVSSPFHAKKSSPFSLKSNDEPKFHHEWALVNINNKGGLKGAHAKINTWSPTANPQGGSYSQIWVGAGGDNNLNSIEIGWRVVPTLGYSDPRMFIYWTSDNYGSTGCYNMDCPGFISTIPTSYIGGKFDNISAYDGVQFDVEYEAQLDPQTNNWWITLMGAPQGYYPSELFTNMKTAADTIGWGGTATDNFDEYYKTATQMGSGHFSDEGYKKSCYVTDITYIDGNGGRITPNKGDFKTIVSSSDCYDLDIVDKDGLFVFFGGPGCSN